MGFAFKILLQKTEAHKQNGVGGNAMLPRSLNKILYIGKKPLAAFGIERVG